MIIHPILNSFSVGDCTIHYNHESRRISCMLVDSNKMHQIFVKQARNKKNLADVFIISVHFAEELTNVKSSS